MTMRMFDVIFYDSVGMAFTGNTPENGGLGGSELEVVVLAEALARAGLSVMVANRTLASELVNNVLYVPHITVTSSLSCKTLVVMRHSAVPNVAHDNLRIVAMDLPDSRYDHVAAHVKEGRGSLIMMSSWQRAQFPTDWRSQVVNPIIPPAATADYGTIARRKNWFIYASAACKGLSETLKMWSAVKSTGAFEDALLFVTSPGYDKHDYVAVPGVCYMGVIPSLSGVVKLMRSCAGLFYVNTFPECYSLSVALAEASGCRPHVLCTGGLGGFQESSNSPMITTDRKKFIADFVNSHIEEPLPSSLVDISERVTLPQWRSALAV